MRRLAARVAFFGRERGARATRRLRAARRSGRWSAPLSFSTLTGRIIALNLIGLVVFLLGVLFLNQYRAGLIDQRHRLLVEQANLLATTLADLAGSERREKPGPGGAILYVPSYDRIIASEVLRRLTLPSGMRAQIIDHRGYVTGDTRRLPGSGLGVELIRSSPPTVPERFFQSWETVIWRASGLLSSTGFGSELYAESPTPGQGIAREPEVWEALDGREAQVIRYNSEGELVLSVAVPIRRVEGVMGALLLSTPSGKIDGLVTKEVDALLLVAAAALGASLLVSLLLAQTIARPIRRLAEAAEPGVGGLTAGAPQITIPDMTDRADEIGDLSGALRRMTGALYDRIGAIESFAADVAHELKNPLTSLASAVETMRLAKTPEAQEKLLRVLEHDVQRMNRLVSDISSASRLDAELVRARIEAVDLKSLLTDVVGFSEHKAQDREVRLSLALAKGPLALKGLENRLAQVFHNLIDNALSFSPAGGSIRVRAHPAPGARTLLRVEVEDDGPGIPPDNLESIFERFYSERSGEGSFGNHSGLGLSICRQIIEAHDGRIWAENRSDQSGARFVVVLPR